MNAVMPKPQKVEYYDDKDGKVRWRVRAGGNNKIVSASDEGFDDLRGAMDNYQLSLVPAQIVEDNTKKGKKNDSRTAGGPPVSDASVQTQAAHAQAAGGRIDGPEDGSDSASESDSGHGDQDPEGT